MLVNKGIQGRNSSRDACRLYRFRAFSPGTSAAKAESNNSPVMRKAEDRSLAKGDGLSGAAMATAASFVLSAVFLNVAAAKWLGLRRSVLLTP